MVGGCWAASLATAHAWTWVPPAARTLFALTLASVVAALLTAATSRRSYRRTHLGLAGGLGVIALDAATVTAILLAAPTLVWPMAVAIPASLTRIGLTLRSLPAGRRR